MCVTHIKAQQEGSFLEPNERDCRSHKPTYQCLAPDFKPPESLRQCFYYLSHSLYCYDSLIKLIYNLVKYLLLCALTDEENERIFKSY